MAEAALRKVLARLEGLGEAGQMELVSGHIVEKKTVAPACKGERGGQR